MAGKKPTSFLKNGWRFQKIGRVYQVTDSDGVMRGAVQISKKGVKQVWKSLTVPPEAIQALLEALL